ncbi:MAG TPA: SIR2 family protein [Mycobacteriales bacterium]|nr:SIR2 family protein [Mycobacteriales bacterium]
MLADIYRPCLSWHAQPELAELFRIICDGGDKPVTIICGAGVSLDAGLPSWGNLVDRMCNAIRAKDKAALVRSDPVDPTRKVGYILGLTPRTRPPEEIVREALYDHDELLFTGGLADAIARLVREAPHRFRLLTTNFDSNLEQALKRYFDPGTIRAIGLRGADSWFDSTPGTPIRVLHVHGMVAPRADPVKPVILSEAFYLRYGGLVRQAIFRALRESHCLLVGVSLSDLNILGPVSELNQQPGGPDRDSSTFLFAAPDPPAEAHPAAWERSQEYLLLRAEYFRREFGIKVVTFKSFGQIPQVLRELPLAMSDPDGYRLDAPDSSLRYGHRLVRTLTQAYRDAGAQPGEPCPTSVRADELRQRLSEALEAEDGPLGLIGRWREELAGESLARRGGLDRDFLAGERFALFLWLRASADSGPEDAEPYAINLIGCSAYSHPEGWSFSKCVPISPLSEFPAAKALFYGVQRLENMEDMRRSPLWRAMLATPVTVGASANQWDVLTIGAVTLNTSRSFVEPAALEQAIEKKQDVRRVLAPSIVSLLANERLRKLSTAVHQAALEAIKFA